MITIGGMKSHDQKSLFSTVPSYSTSSQALNPGIQLRFKEERKKERADAEAMEGHYS